MKILIFGHSRSGSTILQKIISKKYNLFNYKEGWTDNPTIFDALREQDNFVIKVVGDTLLLRNSDEIPLEIFDKVFVTDRDDKTAAMASLYLSTLTDDWIQPSYQELVIPMTWFLHYSKIIESYYIFLKEIKEKRPDYIRLEYKNILDLAKEEGLYSASNMDYETDCKNYADMSVKMRYLIDKLEQKFGKF